MIRRFLLPCFAAALCAGQGEAAVTFFGLTPYRQRSDSPFYAGLQADTLYFEDFEDGQLSPPRVAVRNGSVGGAHGVDEDDGALDNVGINNIWKANGLLTDYGSPWSIEISFTPTAEQGYPKYAGLALLGFSTLPPDRESYHLFRAYDGLGNDVTGDMHVNAVHLPPDTPLSSALGDQFVGIYSDNGISKILLLSSGFDHLQFGYTIPEPGAFSLCGGAGLLLLSRRRRATAIHDRNGAEPT